MSDLVLKIENLTKTYKLGKRDVQPLTNLNLEVKRGEFTAIMGPSGSGKTTLLNVIGCIDKASSGIVLIDNVDIAKLPESKLYKIRRDKIGFIFQNFNLYHTSTPEKTLSYLWSLQANSQNNGVNEPKSYLPRSAWQVVSNIDPSD